MKSGIVHIVMVIVGLMMIDSCNRPDNFKPVVEYLEVESERMDTLLNLYFPIKTTFLLTDNEGVQEYRFEFIRKDTSQYDLHFLEFNNINGPKSYEGEETIDFNTSILDTIQDDSLGYYYITLDCYDQSGNVAQQKKVVVTVLKP